MKVKRVSVEYGRKLQVQRYADYVEIKVRLWADVDEGEVAHDVAMALRAQARTHVAHEAARTVPGFREQAQAIEQAWQADEQQAENNKHDGGAA